MDSFAIKKEADPTTSEVDVFALLYGHLPPKQSRESLYGSDNDDNSPRASWSNDDLASIDRESPCYQGLDYL